jgi:DNA-binding XRE family transcriptional regulator
MAKVRKKVTKVVEKRPVGRPTKYDPAFCQRVIDFMAQGFSKEAVAGELHIHKETLYEWEKAHKDFSDSLKQGVELSRKFWEKIALDHLTHTAKGKQLNSTVWIFNMKNRFAWSDKKEIDIGEKTAKTFGFKLDVAPDLLDEAASGDEEEQASEE